MLAVLRPPCVTHLFFLVITHTSKNRRFLKQTLIPRLSPGAANSPYIRRTSRQWQPRSFLTARHQSGIHNMALTYNFPPAKSLRTPVSKLSKVNTRLSVWFKCLLFRYQWIFISVIDRSARSTPLGSRSKRVGRRSLPMKIQIILLRIPFAT